MPNFISEDDIEVALGISANTTLIYQAPVSRFDANVHEDDVEYGGKPPAMGFFAPRDNFGATLQAATAFSPHSNG